jgi:predicted site-specific integrase-resolvase
MEGKELATNFVGAKKASQLLGVHKRTLYNWDSKGIIEVIRTPGNKRLFNVAKFLGEKQKQTTDTEIIDEDFSKGPRINIAYIRVSSRSQEDDLEHQREFILRQFPNHKIIEDIGSGMNLNRRGLMKIIHYAIAGRIEELVVAYRDRLARFGFELIEELIHHYSHGRITVINADDVHDPEEEVIRDTLQLMNIFVAKMNGLRKYRTEQKRT